MPGKLRWTAAQEEWLAQQRERILSLGSPQHPKYHDHLGWQTLWDEMKAKFGYERSPISLYSKSNAMTTKHVQKMKKLDD